MPLYLFENPKTGETAELVQQMKDPHVFVDEDGLEWDRVWVVPNASIDTHIDPFDEKSFVRRTGDKKGTVGDIWDYSKELSEKRIDKEGKDSIKEKWGKDRAKKLGKRRRDFLTKQAKKEVVRREKKK